MTVLAVVGAGAWGTALAATAARAGTDVALWCHEPGVAQGIDATGENRLFLPGILLPKGITATPDLAAAIARAAAVLLVVPAQHMRQTMKSLASSLPLSVPLIIASKGIERDSGASLAEIAAELLPGRPVSVLSGPTFAAEVALGLPTAVTLAAAPGLGDRLRPMLATPQFRIYLSPDIVGCEIGGAVKNVMAIACGIVMGRGLGDNARAALITRGLAEMVRLATRKGGDPATLMGLSGLGDLGLTCTALQSRNCSLGVALGRGETLRAVLSTRRSVAEGVDTAAAVALLARRLDVEMPIVAAVDAILHHGAEIDQEIARLLARPSRAEVAAAG